MNEFITFRAIGLHERAIKRNYIINTKHFVLSVSKISCNRKCKCQSSSILANSQMNSPPVLTTFTVTKIRLILVMNLTEKYSQFDI